jgi:hypothetical protein
MPVKNSGMIMGSTVASSSTRLASLSPAMSVHLHDNSQQYNITVIHLKQVTPEATMILVRKQAAAEQPGDSCVLAATCLD